MSRSELSQRRQRLLRKLAASFQGWHSGRVDCLAEALRAIERELDAKTAALQENETCSSVFPS